MIEYGCGNLNSAGQVVNTSDAAYAATTAHCTPFSVTSLMYDSSFHQLWEQFRAAIFVILWSAVITFILMKLIGLVLRGARYKDEILEIGDLAIHDEEAFPEDRSASLTGVSNMGGGAGSMEESVTTNLLPPTEPGTAFALG
jgi:hypothetical protein